MALAVVVFFSTRAVQADARLLLPTSNPSAASEAASATPASLARPAAAQDWKDRLHGIASGYGGVFDGRTTARGERFDMNAMTACHPSLPFGSIVRVVNRRNKRSVVVRITDRGDLIDEGRIIDLSYAAAQKLAMIGTGLAPVDLEVISLGKGRRAR